MFFTMTTRLRKAIERVQELPDEKQDWLAQLLLEALDAARDRKDLPFWLTATPEQRAVAFEEWVKSFTGGAGIPDEALRRVNMYD
jgi:hypothetical protein